MLTTSQAYKNIMQMPVMESSMQIVIDDGTNSITLHDRDIVSESFKINWRASNNKTLSLGTCYASQLNFSAFRLVESGIEGQYITITPTVFYNIGGGNEEEIPLGVYRCSEPVNYGKTTAYECFDMMLNLDKKITSRFTGTPYNVLTFICSACGVTLGNTSQQISAMVNGSQSLVIDPNQVANYRDALSYVSMVLGGYAQFGRDGKLYVRQFHTTADMTLPRKRRESSSFAGYRTMFAGVKCRFLASQNFYPYEYDNPDMDVGVIVDLGDVPIIEGNEQLKHAVLGNIYSAIQNLVYDPCEIDYAGDPSIEAGDMIATPDRFGYTKNLCLTSVTFAWHARGSALVSEGANPEMGLVTTKAKKTAQAIDNSTTQNEVITATFVNADTIAVGSASESEITNIKFTVNKDLTAIFGAEIPVYSDGDGYLTITYENNGVDGDVVTAQIHEGYNLVTLVNHMSYDAGSVVILTLDAQTSAIGSGTAPSVTIAQDKIRSYIFAQGIEVEAPWDGIIVIAERVPYVASVMAMYGITESVSVEALSPEGATLSEVVEAVTSGSQVYGISDTMSLSLEYGDWVLKMGMGHLMGMGRMLAPYSQT